jgi:NTE family protein
MLEEQQRLDEPVRRIPTDPEEDRPEPGIALCLSGGGFRAMLFHVGALWRLLEAEYLRRLARISSVSGGSIIAARLGLVWDELELDRADALDRFRDLVVDPIRRLAGRTIDVPAIARGLLLPGTINARLAAAYRSHLYRGATLQSLPVAPRFVINATNLQSGALWRFSRPYMWDYRVGQIPRPEFPLADAVAASSAFPPVLSPARPTFREEQYAPASGDDLQRAPYTTKPVLTDGGVYDNLGLETAWKRCRTVLISDGGGAMIEEPGRWRDWATQSIRVLKTVDNQVRSLRKRQAIAAYTVSESDAQHRFGAYWGIRSDVEDYELESSMDVDANVAKDLAAVPTRLKRMDTALQEGLINWGYAICDTAMRRWVDDSLAAPSGFPYPEFSIA